MAEAPRRIDGGRRWFGRLAWSLLYGLGTQVPVLVSFVVVARHVAPEGFGTMALAWLVAGVGQVLLLETVGDGLVRRAEVGRADRDTTFWMCLGLGIALAALTAAAARPASRAFEDETLASVLPVLAVRLVFDALSIVPDALLRRAYAVRSIAVRGAVANGVAAAAAIALAAAGCGVWSLAAQQVVFGAVGAAVSWSAAGFRPAWPRARPAGDVWSYAANAGLFRSVDYGSANLDRFLVGKVRGPTDLGHYAVALRLQSLALEVVVGNALRLVALPMFAGASGDKAALRRAFLKSLSVLAAVAFPCFAGAAALAGPLVAVVFGEAWRPAVPVVQILLVEAPIAALAMLNSALLRALGKPDQWLLVQVAAAFGGALLVLAAVERSLVLVAAAVLAKSLLVFPLHLRLARRACGFTLAEYFRRLLAPSACAGAMAAAVAFLEAWSAPRLSPAALLGAGVAAGALAYAAPMLLVFRRGVARALRGGFPAGRLASATRSC